MHEARSHAYNSFITLTYDDDYLPPDQGLNLEHWQQFFKRLRQYARRQLGIKKGIKFFHCGEYGPLFKRPHYHACVFGLDFPDKKIWRETDFGNLYTSDDLANTWGMGFVTIGDVTWESAAYVARYTMKKVNGALAERPDPNTGLLPYERTHLHTGEINQVRPEYATMSRNPGIGASHLRDFIGDYYPWDEIIVNGHPSRPPRYYDSIWETLDPESMCEIKEQRVLSRQKHAKDNTRARLKARETVKAAAIKTLQKTEEFIQNENSNL